MAGLFSGKGVAKLNVLPVSYMKPIICSSCIALKYLSILCIAPINQQGPMDPEYLEPCGKSLGSLAEPTGLSAMHAQSISF